MAAEWLADGAVARSRHYLQDDFFTISVPVWPTGIRPKFKLPNMPGSKRHKNALQKLLKSIKNPWERWCQSLSTYAPENYQEVSLQLSPPSCPRILKMRGGQIGLQKPSKKFSPAAQNCHHFSEINEGRGSGGGSPQRVSATSALAGGSGAKPPRKFRYFSPL